jgi:hypothetical protein
MQHIYLKILSYISQIMDAEQFLRDNIKFMYFTRKRLLYFTPKTDIGGLYFTPKTDIGGLCFNEDEIVKIYKNEPLYEHYGGMIDILGQFYNIHVEASTMFDLIWKLGMLNPIDD